MLANNGIKKKIECEVYQQLSSNYQWLQIKTPKIPYMDHWLQRDGWFQLVVDKVENTFTSRQDLPLDSDFFLAQIPFLDIFGYPKSHFIPLFKALMFQSTCFSAPFPVSHPFCHFAIAWRPLLPARSRPPASHGQKCLDLNDDNWLVFVGA